MSSFITRALIAVSLVSGLAAPAMAAPRGGAYVATLATPLTEAKRELVDGRLWKCEGDRCTAPYDGSHAARTCAQIAGKVGPVAAFATPRGGLKPEDLATCNAAR